MLSPQDTVTYATILLRLAIDWPYRVKAKRAQRGARP
jgi:hypothetical protein